MDLNELKGIRFFDATETKMYFNCAFKFCYNEYLIYDIHFGVIYFLISKKKKVSSHLKYKRNSLYTHLLLSRLLQNKITSN